MSLRAAKYLSSIRHSAAVVAMFADRTTPALKRSEGKYSSDFRCGSFGKPLREFESLGV